MKDRTLFTICAVFLVGLAIMAYYFRKHGLDVTSVPVDRLVSELENNHRRSLEHNHYSLNYQVKAPDTVKIVVKYYKDVNRKNMKDAIESARHMVYGMGKQVYGMEVVRIPVEIEMIEIPESERIKQEKPR